MPELPEVEVVRLFLESHIVNKSILSIKVITAKSFIGNPKLVEGQKIIGTSRVGKQLSLHLQNGLILLFHLKMTGQVIYEGVSLGHPTPKEDKSSLPNKSTRLIFGLSDNSNLYFNDQRKFGWVKLFTKDEIIEFQKNLGIDVLSPKFTLNYFYQQLQTTSRDIKTVLLDQSKFAGVGNIYANDVLFISHLHPQTISKKITKPIAKILHQNLISLIRESLSHGGSTAKDNKYIHPDGSTGQHQYYFRVYQKANEACSVCHTPIKRISLGGRGTFYCPNCQKRLLK